MPLKERSSHAHAGGWVGERCVRRERGEGREGGERRDERGERGDERREKRRERGERWRVCGQLGALTTGNVEAWERAREGARRNVKHGEGGLRTLSWMWSLGTNMHAMTETSGPSAEL